MVAFELYIKLFVVAIDLLVFTALKERLSGQQDMEDSAHREDVAGGLDVLGLGEPNDLGCHIARSSTAKEEILFDIRPGR